MQPDDDLKLDAVSSTIPHRGGWRFGEADPRHIRVAIGGALATPAQAGQILTGLGQGVEAARSISPTPATRSTAYRASVWAGVVTVWAITGLALIAMVLILLGLGYQGVILGLEMLGVR